MPLTFFDCRRSARAALALVGLCALFASPLASAAPFTPKSDTEVVERLPGRASDPSVRRVESLRKQLAARPDDAGLRTELGALSADVERLMANRDAPRSPAGSTPGIDNQAQQISQRIDEGVKLGLITQREARRLKSREREIARHETFFKSDGVVTQQERRQLRSELDELRQEVERHINNDSRNRS